MFKKKDDQGYRQQLPGIQLKTLSYGEKTLLARIMLAKGSALPNHSHPHEQTGYMISGKMRLTIGAETFLVEPGDSWCIPSNLEHSAEPLEDTVVIEVFSPVRQDYLPALANPSSNQ